MTEREWPSEWLRGVLEVCVLRILTDGATWGYAIADKLEVSGFGAIKGGTLYPLLSRLESAGYVSVEWRAGNGGPGRKYFSLTGDGVRAFEERAAQWQHFTRLASGLLEPTATSGPAASTPVPPHGSSHSPSLSAEAQR